MKERVGLEGGGVGAPLLDELGHVVGHFAVEVHLLAGDGVHEAEGLGVQGLTGAGLEAVLHKLHILARGVAAQHAVAAIALVVEQGVPDILHVHPDLVRAASFELALHECYMGKVFNGMVVCYSMFAQVTVGKDAHEQAVAQAAPNVALNGTVHLLHLAPHECHILALGGLVEELQSERGLGTRCLGHHEQSRSVFVDAVHQTHAGVGHIVVGIVLEVPG